MSEGTNFKSLLKSAHKKSKDRWYPNSIANYREIFGKLIKKFSTNNNISDETEITSNLAYNMQILEYIKLQLDSLVLSSVIQKMLYKSFIITGMSVVEALFYIILANNDKLSTEWEREIKFTETKGDRRYTMIIEKEKTTEPVSIVMPNLDTMIKKLNKLNNKKILNCNLSVDDFPVLKNLRKLRNRVHINGVDSNNEGISTDYDAFSADDYDLMNRVLEHLLGIKLGEPLKK